MPTTRNSTEYAVVAAAAAGTYGPLKPNQLGGRVRMAFFSLNTTNVAVENGDTINLVKIPAGARVIGGQVAFGAMGANATLTIGDAGDPDRLLAALDVSAAGTAALASKDVVPGLLGHEYSAETIITGTAGGANYAAAKVLHGYILYVVD